LIIQSRKAAFLAVLIAAAVSASPLESNHGRSLERRQAKPKGLKIQWMGHSFHQFLPTPVGNLAKEAGI
jgi:hypothetical protein